MMFKGRPLNRLSKQELMELCERLFDELRMVGATLPEDLSKNDASEWLPPKNVNQVWKGNGKAGGK
jgi:hypothetical protein